MTSTHLLKAPAKFLSNSIQNQIFNVIFFEGFEVKNHSIYKNVFPKSASAVHLIQGKHRPL